MKPDQRYQLERIRQSYMTQDFPTMRSYKAGRTTRDYLVDDDIGAHQTYTPPALNNAETKIKVAREPRKGAAMGISIDEAMDMVAFPEKYIGCGHPNSRKCSSVDDEAREPSEVDQQIRNTAVSNDEGKDTIDAFNEFFGMSEERKPGVARPETPLEKALSVVIPNEMEQRRKREIARAEAEKASIATAKAKARSIANAKAKAEAEARVKEKAIGFRRSGSAFNGKVNNTDAAPKDAVEHILDFFGFPLTNEAGAVSKQATKESALNARGRQEKHRQTKTPDTIDRMIIHSKDANKDPSKDTIREDKVFPERLSKLRVSEKPHYRSTDGIDQFMHSVVPLNEACQSQGQNNPPRKPDPEPAHSGDKHDILDDIFEGLIVSKRTDESVRNSHPVHEEANENSGQFDYEKDFLDYAFEGRGFSNRYNEGRRKDHYSQRGVREERARDRDQLINEAGFLDNVSEGRIFSKEQGEEAKAKVTVAKEQASFFDRFMDAVAFPEKACSGAQETLKPMKTKCLNDGKHYTGRHSRNRNHGSMERGQAHFSSERDLLDDVFEGRLFSKNQEERAPALPKGNTSKLELSMDEVAAPEKDVITPENFTGTVAYPKSACIPTGFEKQVGSSRSYLNNGGQNSGLKFQNGAHNGETRTGTPNSWSDNASVKSEGQGIGKTSKRDAPGSYAQQLNHPPEREVGSCDKFMNRLAFPEEACGGSQQIAMSGSSRTFSKEGSRLFGRLSQKKNQDDRARLGTPNSWSYYRNAAPPHIATRRDDVNATTRQSDSQCDGVFDRSQPMRVESKDPPDLLDNLCTGVEKYTCGSPTVSELSPHQAYGIRRDRSLVSDTDSASQSSEASHKSWRSRRAQNGNKKNLIERFLSANDKKDCRKVIYIN